MKKKELLARIDLLQNDLESLRELSQSCAIVLYRHIQYHSVIAETIVNNEATDPGPKVIREGNVETKTTGQLIDELIIMNQRIWMLIDKVIAGIATTEEAQSVQKYNAQRNEYVRALDRRLNPESGNHVGAKVYGKNV